MSSVLRVQVGVDEVENVLSILNTPPVPAQFPLIPKDVTPAMTLLFPRKLGPPESPKQVPPVA